MFSEILLLKEKAIVMALFGKKRTRIDHSNCFLNDYKLLCSHTVFLGILFTPASTLLRILGIQINCIALHFLAGTQCNEFQTSV